MKTRSIDVAAYLHLCGVEPDRIESHEQTRTSIFVYYETRELQMALENFADGAPVPAIRFAEARAEMKALGKSSAALEHYHRAVDDVLAQIRRRRL